MTTKYAYEYGKRWNARTLRRDIAWVVGNLHVGTTESEISAEIEKRLAKAGPEFTPAIRRECVAYAQLVHQANRSLFRRVVTR